MVKNLLQRRRPLFNSWVTKIPWRRDRLPAPILMGFTGSSDGKESACNVGDLGSIPGLGRSPDGGHGNPLQCSYLGNPHGQRSLAGCSPWDHKEADMTEQLSHDWIVEKATEFQKSISFTDYAKAFDYVDHNKLCKVLQEIGIPYHLICLLRNLYADQEATVRTGHGTTNWLKIGKGI